MSVSLLLALLVVGFVLVGSGIILSYRRRPDGGERRAPPSAADPSELEAAAASEAIEDMVNRKLAEMPALADRRVDFGTAADGSLEIWVGDERYTSVDAIRDPRIRQAVRDAVEAFNR